ncbi:MAG: efflux RND transporter permease subunit [Planctomycetota bacterium]
MNLPRFSVRRPIFTTMATLVVVILGAFSLSRLRIDLLPAIELPNLTVRTEYEGASPEVVERLVTQIIEEIVGTVPGVKEMTSVSSEGASRVRVTFVWGTDLDTAAQDVQVRIENEMDELPDDVGRPRVSKFDVAAFPVVIVGISGDLDPVELTQIVDDEVRPRLARIPGVAQADVWGGYPREVRVELDPARVRALEVPLDRIVAAIRDANLDLPAGSIDQGRYEVTIRAPSEFADLDELRRTVVARRDGAEITVEQLGRVVDTHERLSQNVRVNGSPGLRIAIRKQADANTVEVSRNVLDELDRINRDYPQVRAVAVSNQGNFIERSISNVAQSVLYGGGLAVLVLLFFLRNLRSTVVISLAIPISIVSTFALIYGGGLTLNLMTLGGLALGVGMMVDSSIVVLENVFRRHQENRESPTEAAVAGAVEVGPAIVASTITTLVIFLPLVFVRGVSGLLFRELGYVIAFSLVCSLLVSLSLVPMLASKLLRAEGEARGPGAWLARVTGRAFAALDEAYRDALRLVLRQRLLTVAVALGLLAGSLMLYRHIGTEFLPPSDEGEVRVTGEMEIGTRLDLVDRQTRLIESVVAAEVPETTAAVTSVGGSSYNPADASRGEVRLTLSAAKDRTRSNSEVAAALRRKLDGRVPGMTVRTRAPQGQFLLERVLGGDEGLTVEIRGEDIAALDLLAERVAATIAKVEGVTDVEDGRKPGVPQERFDIDRDRIGDLGLSVRHVVETLETAIAGRRAGEYRTRDDSHRILVQLADVRRLSIEEILDLTVETPAGEPVALRNLVSVRSGEGPLLIDRKDQQRIVTVKANVAGRDMGSVAEDVSRRLEEIARPAGYDLEVGGAFREQREAFDELVVSIALALLLVYMVLACQYESLRDPFVVMLSVPLAAVGVLVTLFLTETTLNVQSYIGCIMLGGIVVNNAILLVDQSAQLREREGLATREAIAEAGRRRLRPILMTSLTTILGLMPLALGIGEGADAQAPLARAVVGGLAASTLITLFLIPAVYSLLHPDRKTPAR